MKKLVPMVVTLVKGMDKMLEKDDKEKESITISARGDCTLGFYKGRNKIHRNP